MGDFCLGLLGFRLEFGDGGVVFGLGVIFKNDFLRCVKTNDHVFDGSDVGLPLTDFLANFFANFFANLFASFLALLICFFCDFF